jgi:hypothetical protein
MGALVLEIERMGRPGAQVVAEDFPVAFLIVAAIAACSTFIFMRLPKGAGASLSAKAEPVGTDQKTASEPAPFS